MAVFFGFLSMVLTVGLGATCILPIKQRAQIEVLSDSSQKADEELTACRASFSDLKAKADRQIRNLMQKLHEETAKTTSLGQSLAYQLERIKRWQAIVDAEAEAQPGPARILRALGDMGEIAPGA